MKVFLKDTFGLEGKDNLYQLHFENCKKGIGIGPEYYTDWL